LGSSGTRTLQDDSNVPDVKYMSGPRVNITLLAARGGTGTAASKTTNMSFTGMLLR